MLLDPSHKQGLMLDTIQKEGESVFMVTVWEEPMIIWVDTMTQKITMKIWSLNDFSKIMK